MIHGTSLRMMRHVVLLAQDGSLFGAGTQGVPGISW